MKIIRILLKPGPLLQPFLKASFGLFLMEFSCEGTWFNSCIKSLIAYIVFSLVHFVEFNFQARKLTFHKKKVVHSKFNDSRLDHDFRLNTH